MKRIILLSMLVMALFVNCTSTEKKAGSSSKELNPQLKGGIFLTSFYTGVKYNDVVVKDKNGAVIFEDNFSVKKDNWEGGDEWETVDGQVQMLDSFNFDSRYASYNGEWEPATIIVKGTRVEGDEGICVGFGAKDADHFYQFNVGGWASTKTALQKVGDNGGIMAEAKNAKLNAIPLGKEVELKVELNGNNVKCYIDGQLAIEYNVK